MDMGAVTFEDYVALFQKKSLKSVKMENCSSVDLAVIRKAAEQKGFGLDEQLELNTYFFTAHATVVQH